MFNSLAVGFIVAGGEYQTQVKLFKPNTKEVCNLPDLPGFFCFSSINLMDGTALICGSCSDISPESRMKYFLDSIILSFSFFFSTRNETKNRKFHSNQACIQLSPASKEAEWTIYTEDLPPKKDHVSFVAPEGILLLGGSNSLEVSLVNPDGSNQRSKFNVNRYIEYYAICTKLLV